MKIKDVFEKECPRLKINSSWATAVRKYDNDFVFSREENIEFLGSGLMGTPRFVFQNSWRHQFFDEILMADDDVVLKEEIDSLPSIDPSHRVRTDVFNLGVIWLVYKINTSSLSPKDKDHAATAVLRVLHYRFLSSLMNWYFQYEPDRATMESTYYALNRKYSLKQHGSWTNLINARVRDILSPGSIHRKQLQSMNDDEKVQYIVSDTQGRIREVVKKMYLVFMEIHSTQSKMLSRKSTFEFEGEVKIRDMIRKETSYTRYINDTIRDRNALIKDELIRVVLTLASTATESHLRASLDYIAYNNGVGGDRRVEKLIDVIMAHAFQYLRSSIKKIDLVTILTDLRSLYLSSRTSNAQVIEIRTLGREIVAKATGSRNESAIASARTAMCLYLIVRTFARDHYVAGGTMEDDIEHEINLLLES